MPPLSQISPELAFLAGRAVFLVLCFTLAAWTFVRWRRANERSTELFFEQNTLLLQRLGGLEEQLTSARQEIAGLHELMAEDTSQRTTPAPPAAAGSPSYQIAIRLARSGAPCEELMSGCGLTRQEAELVLRLHGRNPRARFAVAS